MLGWRVFIFGAAALTLVACYGTSGDDDGNAEGNAGAGGSSGSAGNGGSGNAAGSGGSAAAGGAAATGGSGGASGAGNGGSSGASAAGGASGAAGSSGSAGGDTRGTGQVTVLTLVNYPSPGLGITSLSANFQRAGAAPAQCPVTEYGPCSYSSCDPSVNTDPVDAGTITATSTEAAFAQAIVPLDGTYAGYSEADSVFLGEESISFSAAGGVVPAFQATLPYPLLLLLTAPAIPEGESIVTVARDRDLTLSWDRGTTDVLFQLQSAASGNSSLICSEFSEVGSMLVPSAALAAFSSGTRLTLFTIGRVPVSAGDYDVMVVAAGAVVAPDRARRIELLLE